MQVTTDVISRHKKFTEDKLKALRSDLREIENKYWCLIANGSYARREASPSSDFDFYILYDPTHLTRARCQTIQTKVRQSVRKIIGRLPASGGAFDAVLKTGELSKNIGGQLDTNDRITRRILFLTEGLPINNPSLYKRQREQLINRYVQNSISDHQLGMFLLNDLIRYYRTVCVDFEFKTFEDGKPWGIRNIKLIFSRKLLYFSGILITAEMAQRSWREKREIFRELCDLSSLDRVKKVCGSAADRAIEEYARFLEAIEDPSTRKLLDKVSPKNVPEEFRRLKNSGHHFSFHLMSALKTTYSESHPIHKALVL